MNVIDVIPDMFGIESLMPVFLVLTLNRLSLVNALLVQELFLIMTSARSIIFARNATMDGSPRLINQTVCFLLETVLTLKQNMKL